MKTDKQVSLVFAAHPDWIFLLADLESPGPSRTDAVTVKEVSRETDACVTPFDESKSFTVVEYQFQFVPDIYARIAAEMALLQQQRKMRPVQGLIFSAR